MTKVGLGRCAALGALVMLAAACDKAPEPKPSAGPTAAPQGPAAPTGPGGASTGAPASAPPAKPGDLLWDVPSAWTVMPNKSPMRRATYKIPAAPGEPDEAEMAVSRAGGTVEANVERWKEQMSGAPAGFPKREEVKVGDLKVTIVEHRGTFTAGNMMPGAAPEPGPKANYALLGAIVEVGSAPYFFKITGPAKSVAAARADFDKLVGSIRSK